MQELRLAAAALVALFITLACVEVAATQRESSLLQDNNIPDPVLSPEELSFISAFVVQLPKDLLGAFVFPLLSPRLPLLSTLPSPLSKQLA